VRPIPLKLLIHTVTYEEKLKGDGWSDGYAQPVTINHVLVQPASSIQRSSVATEIVYDSVLFFDMQNSTPVTDFVKGSKITLNGGDPMYIEKVNTLYAFGDTPHHLEVGLR
jgi:hypothetical protein